MDKILVSTISAHDQSLRYLWFTDDTEVGRSRNSPNPGLKREEALRCDEENGPEVRRLQLPIPFLCPFCGLLCEIMDKSLHSKMRIHSNIRDKYALCAGPMLKLSMVAQLKYAVQEMGRSREVKIAGSYLLQNLVV